MNVRRILAPVLLAAAALALAMPVRAQQAPAYCGERPVRLLVGFAPGGSADLAARVMAESLSKRLGTSFVVDNRPGAGGMVAAMAASKTEPDGCTLLFASTSMSVALALDPSMAFDPLQDLATIGLVAEAPNVLEVPAESTVRSVAQLVERGKGRVLNYGSSGIGTSLHLAGEMLREAAHVEMTHVPYKGSSPALTDLMAGRLDFMFDSLATSMPFIRSGKLRPLAVTSRKRTAQLPDVPTMAEAGFANFEASVWFGLFAPRGTPAPAVARVASAINDSLADPATQRRLADLSMDLVRSESPQKFSEFVAQDIRRWKDTVTRAKVSVKN